MNMTDDMTILLSLKKSLFLPFSLSVPVKYLHWAETEVKDFKGLVVSWHKNVNNRSPLTRIPQNTIIFSPISHFRQNCLFPSSFLPPSKRVSFPPRSSCSQQVICFWRPCKCSLEICKIYALAKVKRLNCWGRKVTTLHLLICFLGEFTGKLLLKFLISRKLKTKTIRLWSRRDATRRVSRVRKKNYAPCLAAA